MSLTQSEFLTIVDLVSPDTVNIWYSDTEPLIVYGLTVPILDNTGTNTIQALQTTQQISLTIGSQNYTFTILSRAERTVGAVTYYFFDVEDLQILSSADNVPILPEQPLYCIPGLQSIQFYGGDYDALINNVENSRESSDKMVSDRYKVVGGLGSQNPVNMEGLRNLTADRAKVQDSNYTTTGWVNSRYEGTKTDNITFGGIDSAIAGRSFEGSFYPFSVDVVTIGQQVSSSLVIYTEYLSTAEEDLPTFPVRQPTKYTTVKTVIPATDTEIQVAVEQTVQNRPGISVGDIISIQDSSTAEYTEYMRVNSIQVQGDTLLLQVTRRWNGSPTATYNQPDLGIEKIKGPVKIYQLQGNRVQGIQKGRILVRDTQEILNIDVLGQIVPEL